MTAARLIAIAAVAAFAQKALRAWEGYSVDVTAGMSMAYPLVLLTIAAFPAIVALLALVSLVRHSVPWASRLLFLSLSLLIVTLQILLPSPRMLGFEMRMSRFSEAEFIATADAIRAMWRKDGSNTGYFGGNIANALIPDHPVLAVSPWPPKIFVGPQSVGISWGSGLTGALDVDIQSEGAENPTRDDASDTIQVYPRVRLRYSH